MTTRRRLAIVAGTILVIGAGIWTLRPHDRVGGSRPQELIFRTESFAINLFPPSLAEINSRRIATLLNAPLIKMSDSGSLTPGLASRWAHEGLVWRFTMSSDARFSDGSPVTAEDAAASLCRTMQPGTSWAWSLSSIAQTKQGDKVLCDGLKVNGDELVIQQSFDASWLADALAGPAGWILPKQVDSNAAYGVVPGAGRYKVKEIVPDSYVLLTPVNPGAGLPPVRFRYTPDDNQAASLMRNGALSTLYLQSPLLKSAVTSQKADEFTLISHDIDRVRVLIINTARLRERGFSAAMIRTFRDALDTSIDRDRLEAISKGIGVKDAHPLPIFGTRVRSAPPAEALMHLPNVTLTVFSEPDAFSDEISAALPTKIGPVRLEYRGVEKGALIGALVDGRYDVTCLVLEATMHSPKFWSSFFEPQGAFVAFGMPIAGIEDIDWASSTSLDQLDTLLTSESNWITLFRETRIDAVSKWVTGLAFTRSGQDDLSAVTLEAEQ